MSAISVDVRDFDPTGPLAHVTISGARIVLAATGGKLVTTATEQLFDGTTGTFTLLPDVPVRLTVTGIAGLITPFWVVAPQTDTSLADLWLNHRFDPITAQPLPAYPSIAAAIANIADQVGSVVHPADLQAAVNAAVNDLKAGAPGALDTLNELAAALGNDATFSVTVLNALGNRFTKAEADGRFDPKGAAAAITLAALGGVTPAAAATDAASRASAAQAAAIAAAATDASSKDSALAASVSATYLRGRVVNESGVVDPTRRLTAVVNANGDISNLILESI